mmetsp:Transcript_15113/g.19915  ORF Transcript_15113/g.19915 Transcript_15113/m.19915 type:complete len:91 (+) Transcript_15113:171-443(+)
MRGTNQGAKISYPSEKMLALYKCIQKYDGQTVAVSNEAENITAAEFLETVLKDPLCQIEKGKQNITPPPIDDRLDICSIHMGQGRKCSTC